MLNKRARVQITMISSKLLELGILHNCSYFLDVLPHPEPVHACGKLWIESMFTFYSISVIELKRIINHVM